MDHKIFKLKEHIKKLASEQKLLKMARKTKLPKDKWEDIRISLGKSKEWTPTWAACEAYANSIRITAYLNLYHELRGSEFRHNNSDKYYYDKCMKEERDLLNK